MHSSSTLKIAKLIYLCWFPNLNTPLKLTLPLLLNHHRLRLLRTIIALLRSILMHSWCVHMLPLDFLFLILRSLTSLWFNSLQNSNYWLLFSFLAPLLLLFSPLIPHWLGASTFYCPLASRCFPILIHFPFSRHLSPSISTPTFELHFKATCTSELLSIQSQPRYTLALHYHWWDSCYSMNLFDPDFAFPFFINNLNLL